jgi:hypothetical protein
MREFDHAGVTSTLFVRGIREKGSQASYNLTACNEPLENTVRCIEGDGVEANMLAVVL